VKTAAGTFTKSLAASKFPYLACTEYDLDVFFKMYDLRNKERRQSLANMHNQTWLTNSRLYAADLSMRK